MRLKLFLEAPHNSRIDINYNYKLSSAIYSLLRFGSKEFSTFLHDIGYKLNGKSYKLFCFALRFNEFKIIDNKIKLIDPALNLIISSPLIDEFVKNFVLGSFETTSISITNNTEIIKFRIKQIESLPNIDIISPVKLFLLSPLVLSTIKEKNGKLSQYYLRPEDSEDINRILTSNLLNKAKLIFNKEINAEALKLEWDKNYLMRHPRITKKITINEFGKYPIDVIGMQAPFTLSGNLELIKIGYECGFGEKNSMGFGLTEVLND
ncbi:CRISPR-associated endoribonuclease Cas6 [Melioribacteraceae bacterium 4301-Me]|uniref:CRISPR-associated endoribonuclease Cas6 n=1 Tax=Pyranulibacter aquaticus TaxID=3163344 RepID=UPI003597460B